MPLERHCGAPEGRVTLLSPRHHSAKGFLPLPRGFSPCVLVLGQMMTLSNLGAHHPREVACICPSAHVLSGSVLTCLHSLWHDGAQGKVAGRGSLGKECSPGGLNSCPGLPARSQSCWIVILLILCLAAGNSLAGGCLETLPLPFGWAGGGQSGCWVVPGCAQLWELHGSCGAISV